ncbi:MAG: DUF4395 domain-containing protein [Sciscionella sp.]
MSVVKIDPRGPRFVASLTTLVLAVALVAAPSPLTIVLLAVQATVFGIGVGGGIQHTPYSWVFRTFVRPRLAAPRELEDSAPPRFAQGLGLVFALLALVSYLAGAALLGSILTGLALAAAILNAAFGFCMGCEIYLLLKRLTPATITHTPSTATKG